MYQRVTEITDVPTSDPLPTLAKYAVGQLCINKQHNIEEGIQFLQEALNTFGDNPQSNLKLVQIKSSLDLPQSQNIVG
jgi:hypothetical protein